MNKLPEVWLRGPVPGVPPLLQPVAHALLQVSEDLPPRLQSLSHEQVWARPGASAPIGFHVAHLAGSLSRLFTYAQGRVLSDEQRRALVREGGIADTRPTLAELIELLQSAINTALSDLREIPEDSLLEMREVGRAKLPSTTLGLLFHAAEHTARHAGQVITLIRVLEQPGP